MESDHQDLDKRATEAGFRFVRDVDVEPGARREAILAAVEEMAQDNLEMRDMA